MESLSSLNPYRLEASQDGLLSAAKLSGPARPLLTTLPQFVALLAQSGLSGPHHLFANCLDSRGEFVGEGAQFTVFRDRTDLLEKVVVKRVRRELIDTGTTLSVQDYQRNRHLRTLELEILALCDRSLRDHPNIVNLHAWGFDYPALNPMSGIPVLFMEEANCSLGDLLERQPSLEVRHQMISDVLAGLACLHGADVVHGDLKPANVLVFEQRHPSVPYTAKLNDFGMCIALEDNSSVSYQSYGGTPGWLAPEIYDPEGEGRQDPFDPRLLFKCDIFSFGLLALSAFIGSGEPPFGQLKKTATDVYVKAGSQLVRKSWASLTSSMTIIIEKLMLATLSTDPIQRSSVDQISLADDSLGYIAW